MFSLVGVAAIVMAAWLVLVPQLHSAATAISTLAAVDPVWLGVAVLAEAGALLSYARLSQHTPAPVRIGFAAMLRIDLATMAVSHITPAGSVVGVGLGYRLLTRSGVSPAKAISGKAVQAVGSAVVLNLLLTVALVFAVSRHRTSSLYSTAIVLILTLLAAVAVVAVVAVLLVRHPLPQRRLGRRPRRRAARCIAGQRITVGRIVDPGTYAPRVGLGVGRAARKFASEQHAAAVGGKGPGRW